MILAVVEVVVERLDAYTIHALYMCAKSNVYVHRGVLVEAWFRGGHVCI